MPEGLNMKRSEKAFPDPSGFSPPMIHTFPSPDDAAWRILRIGSLAQFCVSIINVGPMWFDTESNIAEPFSVVKTVGEFGPG